MKSFLGNFYRHLATFYWSHCLPRTFYYYCPLKIESRVREFRICFRTKTNSIRNAGNTRLQKWIKPHSGIHQPEGDPSQGGGASRGKTVTWRKSFAVGQCDQIGLFLKVLSNKFRSKVDQNCATFWIILKNDIQIYCGYFLEYFHWIYSSNVFALFPLYLRPLF